MNKIKGIHHIALKCNNEKDYLKVKDFYHNILGLDIKREWSEGIMFDCNAGLIEVFNNADDYLPQGVIRHFALDVSDCDYIVDKVKKAGYEVTIEPKDISIPSNPPFPARIAFVLGPLNEEIEIFEEK